MQQTKEHGLVWLCSYPKSGNTWFRVFLANLLQLIEKNEPVALNDVDSLINNHMVTERTGIDKICGFNTTLLTDDELDQMNPRIYSWIGEQESKVSYHKLQKAYTYVNHDEPLIPQNGCLRTIYFVRNPLDVSLSIANHFNCSVDEAIQMLGNQTFELKYFPLRQILLSWSLHVNSWKNAQNLNILFLRYEDMVQQPDIIFNQAVAFLKINASPDIIQQAISLAEFDKLKQYEDTIGFMDKPPKLKSFFRKGKVGDWKNKLTQLQVQHIINDHADTMRAFGYLDNNFQPII